MCEAILSACQLPSCPTCEKYMYTYRIRQGQRQNERGKERQERGAWRLKGEERERRWRLGTCRRHIRGVTYRLVAEGRIPAD